MYGYVCYTMESSTGIGVGGARPHTDRAGTVPVDSKILMFVLYIQLIECYIIKCIWSLTMNISYIFIHNLINEVWNLL